jgi:predicted ATP-grasp superfamily ATP-dependent carboligase
MRIVIINQFSPQRVDYLKAMEDQNPEVILLTRNKHEEKFKSFFPKTIGFENFEDNDYVYSYINDLHTKNPIDRIVATHEFDLVKAGQIRDFLSIPGQNSESAIAFRDKYVMKELLKNVIKTPIFKKVNNVVDLLNFKQINGYPFVLKPVDGAGSVGVKVIKDNLDFESILKKGIKENSMAETFIEGEMYHVDGLFSDGKLLLSCPSIYINGCLAFQEEKYVGSIMLDKENSLFERLNDTVLKVLSNLPTPDHAIAFHAEFFHTPENEIIICEIASRVGGGMIPESIEKCLGIDILSESIRAQCGMKINPIPSKERLGGWVIIPPKRGRLISFNRNIPFNWVADSYIKEDNIGKEFEGSNSSVDSIASFVVEGENHTQILNRIDTLCNWVEENSIWEIDREKITTAN